MAKWSAGLAWKAVIILTQIVIPAFGAGALGVQEQNPEAAQGGPDVGLALGQNDDEPGRTRARPALALDHRFLRSVCMDLLGRPPFGRDYDQWLGKGLREFLDEHLDSPEYWQQWLDEQLYYFLLIDNFRPESEGVRSIPTALMEGRLSVRDAMHRICLSPSFDMRNPGADTFVTVVMEQVSGLRVQSKLRELEIGKIIYDGGEGLFLGRRGDSQADVVKIAIEDRSSSLTFLRREYERNLHRIPPRKELATWARRLHKDPYAHLDIVREWFLSPEYLDRLEQPTLQANRLFVRSLYVDLLDRLPDKEESEALRNALDGLANSAPLRSIVARLLLDSGQVPLPTREKIADPTAWIGDLFLRLLGRPATAQELRTFVGVFRDPECHPATIVYALLSHPEYHTY